MIIFYWADQASRMTTITTGTGVVLAVITIEDSDDAVAAHYALPVVGW